MALPSFLNPEYVEHEVNGEELKFFAISVRSLAKLRDVAKPLVQSLQVILSSNEEDSSVLSKSNDRSGEQIFNRQAHDPEVARLRSNEREKAFNRLVDVLTDAKGMESLAVLVMDSLRENYERPIKDKDAKEMVGKIDLSVWVELLIGLAKANKRVFSPFLPAGLEKQAKDALGALPERLATAKL